MKKTCISKNWIFKTNEYEAGSGQNIDLPHDFLINNPRNPNSAGGPSNGFFDGTKGVYEKFLKFENADHTILDIDGAYMCARIYFNEDLIDMHPYGYTPYLVDLSDKILPDVHNRIRIDVLNVQPSTRWYSGAGLYRDVHIWTGGKVRIKPWDAFITTKNITDDLAEISAKLCITSDFDCDALVNITAVDSNGNTAATQNINLSASTGKNDTDVTLKINSPKLWTCDTPNLYTLKIEITVNGVIEDTADFTFGIRTVTADSENGLRLNGKTIKLKGGCIHHDHGGLGSAEFPAAVYRKLSLLKKAGYNAVRISHYPPSLVLLEICDKIGMLVMDEAFDMWNVPKNHLDYSLWFKDWWQRDISYMVMRDRNHPCVISYSIGNEVFEKNGNSDGYLWSKRLSDEIRKYDDTKLVTSGIPKLWHRPSENAPDDYIKAIENIRNVFDISEEKWPYITKEFMEPLDIVGYNYLYKLYKSDTKLYPNRVIWGSETHALTFYDSWKAVLENSNVIGDFTWTAYDNLGEAGTGRFAWGEDGYMTNINFGDYPWRCCYQGDFDLCGFRRPQSYFREAIWKGNTKPHIFTTHPKHNGDIFSGTGWHWYDVSETWTFDDKYINTPIKTDVYSVADEIIYFLNGKEVARAIPEKGIATAYIPYEKGEIKAVAVKDGKEENFYTLKTTKDPYKVRVTAERLEFKADNRDLCYFDIFVEDENGNLVTEAKNEIECAVSNGELMAVFSGDPQNEDQYGTDKCHVFFGKAVAVVRCSTPADITLYVKSKGLKSDIAQTKAI